MTVKVKLNHPDKVTKIAACGQELLVLPDKTIDVSDELALELTVKFPTVFSLVATESDEKAAKQPVAAPPAKEPVKEPEPPKTEVTGNFARPAAAVPPPSKKHK